MDQYLYDGPVMNFEHCIVDRWSGSTYAVSEEKARCNLTYQFKKQYNYEPRTRISLPGKLTRRTRKEKNYHGSTRF